MEETQVREAAEAHGGHVVAGDLRSAASDLTDSGKADAPSVMGQMPEGLSTSEITSVEQDGDGYVVQIRYAGSGGELLVSSHWVSDEGRPRIDSMKAL